MPKFERREKSQPKHKPTASSGASKAPRPPPVQQPGWKGPTYLHKKPARPKPSSSPAGASDSGGGGGGGGGPKLQSQALPAELQQLVLNVFRDTFPASLDFDGLKPTLQEINAALSERDFGAAFGTEEFREAYAIRWSPSRALCYANLLVDVLRSVACDEPWVTRFLDGAKGISGECHRAVCIGRGVSEVMAFGALLRHMKPKAAGKPFPAAGVAAEAIDDQVSRLSMTADDAGQQDGPSSSSSSFASSSSSSSSSSPPPLHLTLVDTASWASVVAKLERGLKTPPALSKYASAAARANNSPLIAAEAMRVTSTQADVLASGTEALKTLIGGADAALITFFFTLNDLYAASIPKTTKLLVEMSLAAVRGSLLLVVDGVGACAGPRVVKGVSDGKEGKKYPMAWLMDHLLLDKGKTKVEDEEEVADSQPAWEKLMGDECRLFRLEEGLEYPASLENMRFQVHLFRRL